ncbi:MAG: GTP-binding protein [Desulfocapsa sp.]|nr:GTP-binding protein [Desulfocapsa sp.]
MTFSENGANTDMGDAFAEVVLISGFLGAGKTTFLRNILKWSGDLSRTAVLVNEFGTIGIDGGLLEGSGASVVELANGCICCSMQGDLIQTLEQLKDKRPRRLLIEATGVADPTEILAVFNLLQFRKQIKAISVVTVVEADLWNSKAEFGTFIDDQIRAADLVLLNKVDLVPQGAVPEILLEIKEICSSCSVIPTHYCQIESEIFSNLNKSAPFERRTHGSHDHNMGEGGHDMAYVAFSFEEEGAFREKCFHRLMASMPANLYRVKGYVLLGEIRFFINHVGGKTEWVELAERGHTTLTFVGWRVDEQEVIAELKACMA